MRSILTIFVAALLAACSSDPSTPSTTADASTPDATSGGGDAAAPTPSGDAGAGEASAYVEPACTLRNDTGGPGQYADACVQRSWIKDHAGTYKSSACELTIAVDGAVAATFTMKVASGAQAGTYVIAWEGGTGAGNDSYYRFTTDTTFATTKTLNFNAGQKVDGGGERNASLRVEGIDTGTVVYKGRYAQTIGGNTDEVDCGAMTKS